MKNVAFLCGKIIQVIKKKELIRLKKYQTDNFFKIILRSILLVCVVILISFFGAILGFKFFYHDWLNQDSTTRIEKNIKITSSEQEYMQKHNIQQGWFGYLFTKDNQISLPLYQGYAQWILNAGFGEVPTPKAKIGENTFCVASHEYLVDGAFSNYGFSQLQFGTHKGEKVYVDSPDNIRYEYQIINTEVKTPEEGSKITANNYGKDVLHNDKPIMMMYTCYSKDRYSPAEHPKYRYIVTSELVNKYPIPKKENRFYHQNETISKKHKNKNKTWIDKLNQDWLDLLFKELKLQKYIPLQDDGQGSF